MTLKKITQSGPFLLILCSLHSIQSWAEEKTPTPELTPKQAASQAQKKHGGEVISIISKQHYYKIKLLNKGRMKTVTVPPQEESNKNSDQK